MNEENKALLINYIVSLMKENGISFNNFNKIKIEFNAKISAENEIRFTEPEIIIEEITFNH